MLNNWPLTEKATLFQTAKHGFRGLTFNTDDEVFLHLNAGGLHLTDPASTVSHRDPVHPEHGRTLVILCLCVHGLVQTWTQRAQRESPYEKLL